MHETLLVIPALEAAPSDNGGFLLTRKFIDGIDAYAARWPGPVRVLLRRATSRDTNLDPMAVHPDEVSFGLDWYPDNETDLIAHLGHARAVLASLVYQHTHLANICSAIQTPLTHITEYTLPTRRQIIRAETSNPLLRWRRQWWTTQLEKRYQASLALANGVQCNGAPTYNTYRAVNRNPLLYFDSRVTADMLAQPGLIRTRCSKLQDGAPLRLAYSGRLIAMKGADHLPKVAIELKRLGIPFELEIFGDGSLAPHIARDIERLGLVDNVHLRGVVDFKTVLVPHVSAQTDLFVCCHAQGDPSCTYLETMSCGVPIVGYANEALAGVIEASRAGWSTPTGSPHQLAQRIAQLNENRAAIAEAGLRAREFAAEHTFEQTMDRRVDHIQACCTALHTGAAA